MYDFYVKTLEYGFVTSTKKLTFHLELTHTDRLTGFFPNSTYA